MERAFKGKMTFLTEFWYWRVVESNFAYAGGNPTLHDRFVRWAALRYNRFKEFLWNDLGWFRSHE
jgi:hypothetical protein